MSQARNQRCAGCRSRTRETGGSHGIVLAAVLALALTAGLAALLTRGRSKPAALADSKTPVASARVEPASAPTALEPTAALPADAGATSAKPRDLSGSGAAAADALTSIEARLPALAGAAWDEIASALIAGAAPKELPLALRALALDLAGTARTVAGSGPAELTHPAALSRILDEVLTKSGLRLTATQRDEVASLAAGSMEELDRVFADSPSRPRLASIVLEVEAKLDFIDGLGKVFDAHQREVLDRLTSDPDGGGAPLSPLALIEAWQVDSGADADAFRRQTAGDLARGFEIEPGLAATLAASLQNSLSAFFDGSAAGLSPPERALIAARAQARLLADLLRSPGLSPEAREYALRTRTVSVPRVRGDRHD